MLLIEAILEPPRMICMTSKQTVVATKAIFYYKNNLDDAPITIYIQTTHTRTQRIYIYYRTLFLFSANTYSTKMNNIEQSKQVKKQIKKEKV